MALKPIAKCNECGIILHIFNKRYCCGRDYLLGNKVEEITTVHTQIKSKKRYRRKIDDNTRSNVLKRDKDKCVVCGNNSRLHIHHKIPVSESGTDDLDNLETLCDLCHAEKHRDQPIYNLMIKRLLVYENV